MNEATEHMPMTPTNEPEPPKGWRMLADDEKKWPLLREAKVWLNGWWPALSYFVTIGDPPLKSLHFATRQPEESEASATPEDMDPIRMRDCVIADLREEIVERLSLIEELRKELHDVRAVCTEALDALYDAQSVYKPGEDSNYWRWETTGEGLAGIEWDVTTPLTAEQRAALARAEAMKGDR